MSIVLEHKQIVSDLIWLRCTFPQTTHATSVNQLWIAICLFVSGDHNAKVY